MSWVSRGAHTVAGTQQNSHVFRQQVQDCLVAIQVSTLRARSQGPELQKAFALWTPGKCGRVGRHAHTGHLCRLASFPLELQHHTSFLFLLCECKAFSHFCALFFSRIGTIPIFLHFTARETGAWVLSIYELENHMNCLWVTHEVQKWHFTCIRGLRSRSFGFDISLFYHLMKGWKGRMFKKHWL